ARDVASVQSAIYLQGLRYYHDHNVRDRAFSIGDLVLRKVQKRTHKLSAIWEGPYIVTEMTRPGAYKLKNGDGTPIYPDNSWNIDQLRHFYTLVFFLYIAYITKDHVSFTNQFSDSLLTW